MGIKISERARHVAQSEIRNMTHECRNVNGINLAQGVCDLGVPEPVKRAAQEAMDAEKNSYTHYQGVPRLRKAIAARLARYGFEADPEREITVSAGATGAFVAACLATLNPGDEAVLLEPYYGYHRSILLSLDLTPRYAPLAPPGWEIDYDALDAVVGPRTRALVLCTPANPSGKVSTRAEMETLAEYLARRDLLLITDEMYEYFLYDGHEHLPPARVPGLEERTITLSGFSKTFNITGWRIGYAYAPPEISQIIGYFNDLAYVCAPAPLQEGVAAGLELLPESYYEDLREHFTQKRDRMCGALQAAGFTPYIPEGAYYVLADIGAVPGADSKARAMRLLADTGVACVPGEAFYQHRDMAAHLARFCFAKRDDELEEACRRIENWRGGEGG